MVEIRKIETLATKQCKTRGGISLSREKKGNYEINIEDKIDLDQANNEYLLQF